MIQITKWKDPNKEQDTEYGKITYLKWCEKEIKRLGRGKIHTQKKTKRICIA